MLRFLRKRRSLYVGALVALMETAVAIPWMIFCYSILVVGDWPAALPGAWLLMAVYLAANLLEAGDSRQAQGNNLRRALGFPVGVVIAYVVAYQFVPVPMRTGYLSMNPAWGIVPPAAYLWYVGVTAVVEGLSYSRLFTVFTYKCLAAVAGILVLVMAGRATDGRIAVLLYWSVVLLFASGLTALVVAREQELRSGQQSIGDAGEGRQGVSPVVTGTVVALVVLTLAASYVLSVDRLAAMAGAVLGVLGTAYRFVADVAMLLVYRWIYLVAGPLTALFRWLYAHQPPPQELEVNPQDGEPPYKDLENQQYLFDTDRLLPYIQAALLIGAVVVVAVMLYRMAGRRRQAGLDDEEERLSLGFWQNLLADLSGLMHRPRAVGAGTTGAPEALDRRNPRALYRRLQAWGLAAGRPRLDRETPNSYRDALSELHPDQAPAVDAVTAVYNQARYGGRPPADDAVSAAEKAVSGLENPSPDPTP